MFEQLFPHQPHISKRYINAPFLEERTRYLDYRTQQETKRSVLIKIAAFQLIAIKYFNLERKKIFTIEEIKSAARHWRKDMAKIPNYKVKSELKRQKNFIQHVSKWLYFLGRIEVPLQQIPTQITEYEKYMRKERNFSEMTILNTCFFLKNFFIRFGENLDRFLAQLTPRRLDEIITQKIKENNYSRSTIHSYLARCRSFFRYAENRQWCQKGIAESIFMPRNYRHRLLPSGPPLKDIKVLLKSTEGDGPANIRDRAAILLLVIYGLRSREVVRLKLEDFDWEQRTFTLRHLKRGPIQKFPIIPTLGQALARYLKEVRPHHTPYREVFLSRLAPFTPLAGANTFIHSRWRKLHIDIKGHGPHSLRHACATRMINQDVPLKTIADQLGHRNIESTRVYAKVDLIRLREVANSNMGGLLS